MNYDPPEEFLSKMFKGMTDGIFQCVKCRFLFLPTEHYRKMMESAGRTNYYCDRCMGIEPEVPLEELLAEFEREMWS